MLNRLSSSRHRLPLLLMCASLLGAPVCLRAEDALPGVNVVTPGVEGETDEGAVAKRGRITPFNGAALPEGEVPALQSPEDARETDAKKLAPSSGVFSNGNAVVNTQTENSPASMTPSTVSTPVKLFWGHK